MVSSHWGVPRNKTFESASGLDDCVELLNLFSKLVAHPLGCAVADNLDVVRYDDVCP